MKKLLLVPALLVFAFAAKAQIVVACCTDVDKDGYCKNQSTEFNMPKEGGELLVLLTSPNALETDRLSYKVYKINSSGTEICDNTIYSDIQKTWGWTSKGINFYNPGTYKIYIYNAAGTFLGSKQVKLNFL